MSETVHYKGIAKRIGMVADKATEKFAFERVSNQNKNDDKSRFKNSSECLVEYAYMDFFIYKEVLYSLENSIHEIEEYITKAKYLENQTIEYELMYYNGGAGFEECLEEAFDTLTSQIDLEKQAIEEFNKIETEGHFPNHSDRDIWIKGYIYAAKNKK